MSLLFPLGFLALIGVPILIFIYIIKNRYTEQTVTSTYLWTLSERFLKRRIPINRLTGILSLILQILAVIAIALILVHPIINVPNAAEAYCFIIDGSGSMNIMEGGQTRFEAGKEQIVKIIDDSMLGSRYTLVCAGDTTSTVFENDADKSRAKTLVEGSSVSYTESDFSDALGAAQSYFDKYPYAKIYLITDKNYENVENVQVINVSAAPENYALADVGQDLTSGKVKGKVISYVESAKLDVEIYYDKAETHSATKQVETVKSEEEGYFTAEFEFDSSGINFATAKVRIAQSDSLDLDNEVIIYKVENQNMAKTLLVSDNPFFLERLLNASGIYDRSNEENGEEVDGEDLLDIVSPSAYTGEGVYGLYIFDAFSPEEMPQEGSVWIINPQSNIQNSNFSFQNISPDQKYSAEYPAEAGRSSVVREQLKNLDTSEGFHLGRYAKLSVSGKYYELATCEGNPVIFTGTNSYGNRQAVFAFDLRDTADGTMSANMVLLISNLISYSFPAVLENTTYFSGETLLVNMIAGCKSIRIETPNGNTSYPDTSSAVSEYTLEEVGTYNVYLIMNDDTERMVNVYSLLPVSESNPTGTVQGASFSVRGTPQESNLVGIIDNLLIIFIILAVIVVADYGVYCYEQYQLR